jgi:glycosyltransferase involved in cell wall biosynthesis
MRPDIIRPKLDLALPVRNEGACIRATLEEWWKELSPTIGLRFVISEDGSKDNTKEILRGLEHEFPMLLDMVDDRRGYKGR